MNNYRNNGINTTAIGNQLHQHLAERARLEQAQDELWKVIGRGYNRSAEMNAIDKKIGSNTYAIDGLIDKLIRARCRSGRAYCMAIDYLKREIARNQRIAASWEKKIYSVEHGDSYWRKADGTIGYDCSGAYNYLANKKRKVAEAQRRLSQLI